MSATRHTAPTKTRVVELYEAGWRPVDIQRLLEREGIPVPSRNTIWVWTHPEKADRQMQRDLASTRRWRAERATYRWPGVRGPEWMIGRMRVLRAAGVSYAAIGKIMSVDFPKSAALTEHEVRTALESGRPPLRWRRAA